MKNRLTLKQGKAGYRYNIDSFALAIFFIPRQAKTAIDLGAGVGALSIPIALHNRDIKMYGLEITHEYSVMGKHNAQKSGLASYHAITGDILDAPQMFANKKFDAVVSNPPYTKRGAGRLCANHHKNVARHEIKITLAELVFVASRLLKKGGSFFVSMAYNRRDEFLLLLSENDFHETRLKKIVSQPASPPKVFLSEARLGVTDKFLEEAPLVLLSPDGKNSPEAQRIETKYA